MSRRLSIVLILTLFVVCSGQASYANLVTDGLYRLSNHPDGNQAPPSYGLRLDGLDGSAGHKFTFDFDYSDSTRSAAMFLALDQAAGTVRIYGSMYGGLNDPSNTNVYDNLSNETVGWWDVDFTYQTNVTSFVGGDGYGLDDAYVSAPNTNNNGTLSRGFSSSNLDAVYDLFDFSGGGLTFRFGDESAAPGHRGFDGISGWGWMNHSGFVDSSGNPQHVYSSDWLFQAEAVPVPGAALLAALGLGVVGVVRRRASSRS